MPPIRVAALAAHFGRDIERAVSKIVGIIEAASRDNVDLLVLPDASLGGYIGDLWAPDVDHLPPAVAIDGPEMARIAEAAGPMTVCVGYTEDVGGQRYNAAACLSGDGVLGVHR